MWCHLLHYPIIKKPVFAQEQFSPNKCTQHCQKIRQNSGRKGRPLHNVIVITNAEFLLFHLYYEKFHPLSVHFQVQFI